jgi:hypothetical protein
MAEIGENMSYETVEAGIIHLDTVDGYILWPLPLPDFINSVDIANEEPKVFYDLPPEAVITYYNYDEMHYRYIRQKEDHATGE